MQTGNTTLKTDVYGRWPYTWADREKVLELEFPLSEYEARVAKIQEQMRRMKLDALFIHGGQASKSNLRYVSGWESFFGDSFLILSPARDPVLVTNSILHGEPMHSNIQVTWVRDFRPCLAFGTTLKQQSPVDYLAAALAECGALGQRVGYVESRLMPARADREIRAKLAGTELVDASSILTQMRRIKSPAEIEVLRTLAAAVSLGMNAALEAAVPGNTEHDVAAAMYNVVIKQGCDTSPLGMRIQSGERSSMKNVLPRKDKVIREGEIVSIDTSVELYGYQSDHARSTVAGKATPEQIRLLEACVEAHAAGLRAAGPGVKIATMLNAMHEVIEKWGFSYWDWSCGHGFGLDLVEDPIIVPENEVPFEAGQTFFLEPMIVPTEMGCSCFEDPVLITERGAEQLTTSRMRTW